VSRQRSIRQAVLIGVLWGLGHTITILVVGSAIILFGIVIPPRFALTMELSVGLMMESRLIIYFEAAATAREPARQLSRNSKYSVMPSPVLDDSLKTSIPGRTA